MLGASPLLLHACTDDFEPDAGGDDILRGVNLPVEVPVNVLKSVNGQAISSKHERISIDTDLAVHLAVGDQCRIIRDNGYVALYTVGEIRPEAGNNRVRMGSDARKRLGTSNEFAGVLSTTVVAEGLTDQQAKDQDEFIERLTDDGGNTGLAILAPHGGGIEVRTDEQAVTMANALAAYSPTTWLCKGWSSRGSHKVWHITSTDISRNSFPGLDQIADRGFSYAVSFHGLSDDIVLVGGRAPNELRKMVADAIAKVLQGSGIPVKVAGPNDANNGMSSKNIVNWLTSDGLGGVQIEQSKPARVQYGAAIANAVASVYAQLL
jgi:phage replication-related protein YjqB (UPF0714/DUF867 family)